MNNKYFIVYLNSLRQEGNLAYEYNPFHNYQTEQTVYLVDNTFIVPEKCIVNTKNGKEQFDEMNEMIKEINKDQVADEEVLSDHLYYYNRSTEKLMIPSLSL